MLNQVKRKVLIADNDEDVLVALEHALENGGYTTATALSQDQISKLLTEEEFDLCVLDDCLSDNDSIGVLAELQEPAKGPIVIVTYHRFPEAHQETQLRALGVRAFVNKRAHSELVDIVSRLLESRPYQSRGAFDHMT